jgi:hypothetical protein
MRNTNNWHVLLVSTTYTDPQKSTVYWKAKNVDIFLSTQKYKNTTGWIYEYLSKQTGHLSKELLKKKNKNSLDLMCSYVYLLTVVPGSNKTKYENNIKLVRF